MLAARRSSALSRLSTAMSWALGIGEASLTGVTRWGNATGVISLAPTIWGPLEGHAVDISVESAA